MNGYIPTYLQVQSNYPSDDQIKASKIIARATICIPERQGVTIVTAYQLSYYHKFWYIYTANTARSPRKTWKEIRRIEARICYPNGSSQIPTLDTIIAQIVGTAQGAKVTKRYNIGKRNFDSTLARIANPMQHRAALQPVTAKTAYVNRKNALGRAGHFVAVGR
jgi:hypothetical protein